MKFLTLSGSILLLGTSTIGQPRSVAIEPAASKVLWTATKVTGEHVGAVPIKTGRLEVEDGTLMLAEVTLDMTGMTCTDIENEGANAKLMGHLKGPDFFDVAKHGTAQFKTTKVEKLEGVANGKPNYKVMGVLTIKGTTKPSSFDCLFWMDGNEPHAAASLTFDRTQYDIKYRSGSLFPDLGDKIISDQVSITFDISGQ